MSNPSIAAVLFLFCGATMVVAGGLMQGADPQFGLIGSELIAFLIPALVLGSVLLKRDERISPLRLGSLGLSWPALGWVVMTAAVLGFAANAVTGLLAETVPGWADLAADYEAMFKSLMYPGTPVRRAAAIFAIVVIAPLCEEALFRGVMLPLQHSEIKRVWAVVLLNGVMFSIIHMNPLSFVALVAVGAFFAHLAVLSRSIWPSMIAHASLNFVNGVLGPYVLESSGLENAPSVTSYAIAAIVLVPLAGLSWYVGARAFGPGSSHDA